MTSRTAAKSCALAVTMSALFVSSALTFTGASSTRAALAAVPGADGARSRGPSRRRDGLVDGPDDLLRVRVLEHDDVHLAFVGRRPRRSREASSSSRS